MKRFFAALLAAALALAAPASATVSTTPVTLTTSAWTDLGAGPMRIFPTGAGGAWYQIADAQPSLASAGLPIDGPALDVQTSSHVWALAARGATPTLLVAPIAAWGVGPGGTVTLGAGSATIGAVASAGSTGTDYSANKPALPNVGANFGATGVYANYVLIATVPASSTRNEVEVLNASGDQIAVLLDDGTAAAGAAPVNASLFPLAGGSAAGAQGGSWSSTAFKGRLQVFAASVGAQVAISTR